MSEKGWKKFEKRIALRFGGERRGILGGEDVSHPIISFECTQMDKARFPKAIKNKYFQALANCPKGKKPVVIMKEKRRLDDNSFVVMNLVSFEEIFFRAYPELADQSGKPIEGGLL